ncbi:ankyrin repeat-containing domain protein [Mycena filopes]|nr:ankyrin repeat-containing domain protein [Mycena filopes]
MNQTLECLTKKMGSTRLAKMSTRLAWPLWGKEEIHKALTTVERFKSFLTLWLGMDIWDSVKDISAAVRDMAEEQKIHQDSTVKAVQVSTQHLKDDHEHLELAIRHSAEEQRAAHNNIVQSVEHVSRVQEIYHNSVERDNILDWLSPINYFLRQADISGTHQSGTGTWLLEHDVVKRWRMGVLRTVWCRGMPGAGKTVLASMVVENLRASSVNQNVGVAVIYLNHKETEIQTPANLLAALWRQLVVGKPLAPAVHRLYAKHREQRTQPSLEDLHSILSSTISEHSAVYLVVDALDEYPEAQRDLLLRHLSSLAPTVRLMLTSRPHINIKHAIADSEELEIRATEDDIRRYVDAQISMSARLSGHIANKPELREEIETKIVQRSDGMFLLAKLHIDSLITKHTVKAVREGLKNMPADLNRTYDEVMERIKRQREDDRDLAHRALTWIAHAKRLLRPAELREALAVEPGTTELDPDDLLALDTILAVCAGLVIFNVEDNRVCLIHYTTQSYLDSVQAKEFPHAQAEITTACLTYLLFPAFSPDRHSTLDNALFSPTPSTNHLLNYALNYGLVHARGQPELGVDEIIRRFLAHRALWLGMWNRVYYYNKIPERASKLWIAAFFDLREIAGSLIVEGGLDARAVYAAVVNGHAAMFSILTAAGVQVDAVGGYHGTALQVAATTGKEEMVRLLLQSGANVDVQTEGHNSALYEASRRGHEAIVRLLVDHGADVNIHAEGHATALQMASHGGHTEIVRLLLANGADVNLYSKDRFPSTALQMAAIEGHQSIIRILLENGADVNFQTKERGSYSALYAAALMQHDAAVRLLIEYGADVDAKGPSGTALQAASADGNDTVVRLLLANGADVDAEGSTGLTALQVAGSEGHEHIVRLLLEYGAARRKYTSSSARTASRRNKDSRHLLAPPDVSRLRQRSSSPRQRQVHRRTSW